MGAWPPDPAWALSTDVLLESGKKVLDRVLRLAKGAVTIGGSSHGPRAMTPTCRPLLTRRCRAENDLAVASCFVCNAKTSGVYDLPGRGSWPQFISE